MKIFITKSIMTTVIIYINPIIIRLLRKISQILDSLIKKAG